MKTEEIEYNLKGHKFRLEVAPNYLFMPNAVTGLFAKAVKIDTNDIVFDIGSGVGPLAIWSGLEPSKEVHAVEIVEDQYNLLQRNVINNGLSWKICCYKGCFFNPISGYHKADVIIADVSGIAEGPARALGWYPPQIPTGGADGTEVIVKLLEEAGPHLRNNGRLYFPVAVDLSDSEKIMDTARSKYGKLERITSNKFPLAKNQIDSMEPFLSLPYVNLQTKGSKTIWRGEIYEARDPI